ncbi:MAG: GNAT family N-acetyltransferase, partial [Verrucomicrobiota bacterium]
MNLEGQGIKLRQWTEADFESFAAMNADPAVMEFFPNRLSPEESRVTMDRLKRSIEERGWGLWAVEIDQAFAGFTGLAEPRFQARFTPCVEIGWRFHRRYWGQGYALEAAGVALRFAFDDLNLGEVVSFTAKLNVRSQRLMQRLGMTHCPADDFDHPNVPAGHVLQP